MQSTRQSATAINSVVLPLNHTSINSAVLPLRHTSINAQPTPAIGPGNTGPGSIMPGSTGPSNTDPGSGGLPSSHWHSGYRHTDSGSANYQRIDYGPGAHEELGGYENIDCGSKDYERIERAIRYLEARARDQPTLGEVAAAVGLSPFHFQRVFTRLAGVSPKRFLQALTLNHAKTALASRRTMLDAAWDAGLSGPSRLHDLFVTVAGLTPGQYKRQGAGLSVRYGFHHTPFGLALLAVAPRGLCALYFIDGNERQAAVQRLQITWPRADLRESTEVTAPWAERIFGEEGAKLGGARKRERHREPLALMLKGTPFQLQVWQALLRIPVGQVVAYGDLAQRIGRPGAARAVGTALGQNPVAWLIPCHRVIRATGAVGEYGWGARRKCALLAWEAAGERGATRA